MVTTAEKQLRNILVRELGVNDDEITPNSTLEDLGCDSLDVVEIELSIEEEVLDGATIDVAERFECGTSIQQILGLIDQLKEETR